MLARIEDGAIVWYSLLKKKELPVTEIVWAYLQQQDVSAKMCCSTANFPVGRLIVVKKDLTREVFEYDGMEKPKRLLKELKDANPEIAFGYSEENKRRYQAAMG